MKTLILGMGNTILSDDAIGILISRYLRNILKYSNIDIKESSWGGFNIIDLIRNYDYLIVIDSIKTGKAVPGHIHKLNSADLLPTLRLNSYHDINFITAIKLAEALDEKIPYDIDIFAIEVENNFTITENLSKEIQSSIYACSKKIIELLKNKNLISKDFDESSLKEIINDEDLRNLYNEEFNNINNYENCRY